MSLQSLLLKPNFRRLPIERIGHFWVLTPYWNTIRHQARHLYKTQLALFNKTLPAVRCFCRQIIRRLLCQTFFHSLQISKTLPFIDCTGIINAILGTTKTFCWNWKSILDQLKPCIRSLLKTSRKIVYIMYKLGDHGSLITLHSSNNIRTEKNLDDFN